MITVSALNEISRLRHGFFTRNGGVSGPPYASLNCGFGSGDRPESVSENRARAMAQIERPADALVTAYQEHTATAKVVNGPWKQGETPVADALVTTRKGVVLGVLSADCAPVLLADARAGVIAAAHAGWRGAKDGILSATVNAMLELGARTEDLVAAIGPCITQRSYEVGPEFPAPFLAEDEDNAQFFAPSRREGHFMFDLPAYVARRLALIGVREVHRTPCDTCLEQDRFFSFRRATQLGENGYGRLLSAIVLER